MLAVIGGIIVGINIINYKNIDEYNDQILNVLIENEGKIPFSARDENGQLLSPEVKFRTRYFTVVLSEDGDVRSVYLEYVASVTEKQAVNYAKDVMQQGKDRVYYGDYKVSVVYYRGDLMYIFLDCAKELSYIRLCAPASVAIGLGAISVISVLIFIFSGVAVQPMAESYAKQKQFITNANHEIKTPLAIISTSNDVLELEYGNNKWTDTIRGQIKRLNALTERLVFLSKMDEGNTKVDMKNFSLSDMADEISYPFAMTAEAQGKTFETDIERNIDMTGDESLIGQLLTILLDNAIKYSDEGGRIRLSVSREGKNKKIVVENSAENIKIDNPDLLFDRFYRMDSSRNSKTGGYGIGLSVAKSIVNIHKGKIEAKISDGKSFGIVAIL